MTTAPPPDAVREERTLHERSIGGVLAGVLGNCAAGCGAAFVAGVVAHASGANPVALAKAVTYTWLIVWGALMVVWFANDEYAVVRLRYQRMMLQGHLDDAEDEIAALTEDNATLRRENSVLSWRVQESERNRNYTPAVAPESPAYRDARELVRAWGKSGKHPSRRDMGWPDSRHGAAMAVLRGRNVITVGKGNVVTWQAADLSAALSMLASPGVLPLEWSGAATSASQDSVGE